MTATAATIAQRAAEMKTAFLGMQFALVALLHPETPLIGLMQQLQVPATAPVQVLRNDGTTHSEEPLGVLLRRAAATPGAGLRGDVLIFLAMYGATRIADDIDAAKLRDADDPLVEFARHFRNAAAHGNRWHFRGSEPRHRAELRDRRLDATLHGTPALFDWLGPGDFLDFLDDIKDHFSKP